MAALPPLADTGALEPFTGSLGDRTAMAEAVLSQVSNRVRQYLGRTYLDDDSLTDVPAIVVDVVVRVAARYLHNPESLDSFSLDDGTKRWGDTRGMAFTADDLADLAPHRATPAGPVGFGVVSTYRGDGASLDTIYVPTAPEPAGQPFPWLSTDDQ